MADAEDPETERQLEKIRQFAKRVGERSKDLEAKALAMCIDFMFQFMERKQHADAPLFGPDVDEYEDQDTKMARVKAAAAVTALEEKGVLDR